AAGDPNALAGALAGPARVVTADPDRRVIDRHATVQEYFTTTGAPRGHGFTRKNLDDGTAYYAFDRGFVRGIVLDTVNPNGEADGSLDPDQSRGSSTSCRRTAAGGGTACACCSATTRSTRWTNR